jgi:hypothetical protein
MLIFSMSRLKIRMAACNIGSKQLIKTLHSNGFCASYGEVRRYLTSIAHHEIEKIQDGIIPMHQGGGLIQEGADNIDINTAYSPYNCYSPDRRV